MKHVLLLAAVLFAFSGQNAQAEDGQLSDATLAKMGLSNMQVMSDDAGMEVRGKLAFGFSSAIARGGVLNVTSGASSYANPVSGASFSIGTGFNFFGPFPIPVSFAISKGFSSSRSF